MADATSTKSARTAPAKTRRRQLIDATMISISRHGISGATLTAITKEAGLSLGLVNFHFKSKDALLAETLKFLAEEHRDLWMQKLDRADFTPADKLCAIVDAQFHPRVCNRKKLSVWFAFFGEGAYRKSYRSTSSEIDLERQEVCIELCRDIIAEGDYAGPSAEDVVQTLEGLFDGLWLNILMYPDLFTRKKALGQVMSYLSLVFPKHFD
ncbi:TetR/AcrR family transcriptional regulator [Thalassovita sp.]|uniref:TetR/AcrR family transcriptional regulator n=1 Tax=Thalassovita sp. TaxID=1979401 RepID=UPI002B27A5E5|nr:TetR family transcriptional regulator C-terminal domain-containing protein [Thalassovita sp.]